MSTSIPDDPHQDYEQRMNELRAELRRQLDPRTDAEEHTVEWLCGWDMPTLVLLLDMLTRRNAVDGGDAR